MPLGNSPSTHILKFELPREKHATQFETVTTWMTAEIGLDVANIQFQSILSHSVTLSKRFDRYQQEGMIKRLHQEDFCQALGYPNNKIYQTEGGPRFNQCLSLIRNKSVTAIKDINQTIKWQLFNFIVGNSDAHAKNISFLYNNENILRLAPFYDFICTQAYPHINSDLAIHIAGTAQRSRVGKSRWIQFANDSDVKYQLILKNLTELSLSVPNAFISQRDRFECLYGKYHAFSNIESVINKVFKRNMCMQSHEIFADSSVSITELKKNPMAAVDAGKGFSVVVLNHNTPTFYCVPAEAYEALLDKLEDQELNKLADSL